MKVHTIDDFTVYTKDFRAEKKGPRILSKKIDWPVIAVFSIGLSLGLGLSGMIISLVMNWN